MRYRRIIVIPQFVNPPLLVQLLFGLVFGVLVVNSALAQTTAGELLAAGGKQLTKDEALSLLRGATVSGPIAIGGETLAELKENGSMSGYITNAFGRRGGILGTWSIVDAGNLCRDFETRFGDTTTHIKDCFPVYRLGDQIYFPATASSDPSVRILKRTVTR